MMSSTRYFTPANLNLSPTSSHRLPLLQMDLQTSRKIKLAVTDILNSSDLDSVTEKHVRALAADQLRFPLDELPHKILVRQVIESFLLEQDDDEAAAVPLSNGAVSVTDNGRSSNMTVGVGLEVDEVETKPVLADSGRVVCKLSEKREVAVRRSGGKTLVSIRDFVLKDGKQILTPKWIGLPTDQWSILRKSVSEIDAAIAKVESGLRKKREADASKLKYGSDVNGAMQVTAEPMLKVGAHHQNGLMATGKRIGNGTTLPSTPHRLVPIEIVRFDGKNYQQWADRMESYLSHLKIAYVLSVPCPSAVGVADVKLADSLSAIEKWKDDDHVCRQNILHTLCDNLLSHYSKKTGSAKDVWEELKLIYLYEEHGAKVSLVKKYIEFEIVEEKSIFEQVQELHHIADSLIASGMYVEEKFHVNVIISKLPPSWKLFSICLMKEDYIPVWMLMDQLKAEEESRQKGNKNEDLHPRPVFHPAKKLAPQRFPMKKHRSPIANHEVVHEKTIKFCNVCKKKGHFPEQCWFRNSSSKGTNNGNDNAISANIVDEVSRMEQQAPSNP